MNRRYDRAFLDTNMILFAVQYRKENVFSWFNQLYNDLWIHIDVLNELLIGRDHVQKELDTGRWRLFDPNSLSPDEHIIYRSQIRDIQKAFVRLDETRAAAGKKVKQTANTGEISTLAVCLLQDAHLICSNDFDIRDVVSAEHYTYVAEDGNEYPIVQDTAEDFCYHCAAETEITASQVRHFYKTIFTDSDNRKYHLQHLDQRLASLKTNN